MEFYYLKTVNKCEVKGLGQKSWIFAIYAFDNTVHCNLIVATAIFFSIRGYALSYAQTRFLTSVNTSILNNFRVLKKVKICTASNSSHE